MLVIGQQLSDNIIITYDIIDKLLITSIIIKYYYITYKEMLVSLKELRQQAFHYRKVYATKNKGNSE